MHRSDSQEYRALKTAADTFVARQTQQGAVSSTVCPGELRISDFEMRTLGLEVDENAWRRMAPTLAAAFEVDGHFARTEYHPVGRSWLIWLRLDVKRRGADGSSWKELGVLQAEQDVAFAWKNQIENHWRSLSDCAKQLLEADKEHLNRLFRARVSQTALHVSQVSGADQDDLCSRYLAEIAEGFFERARELSAL